MSGLRIIIGEIEKRIREGKDYGCSEERIAELKSLLSFAKSLFTAPEVKNGLEWSSNKEEPEEDRQVLVCIAGFYYVDFYHKKDKRFYMFEKPKHFLHEIDKWIYLDKLVERPEKSKKPKDIAEFLERLTTEEQEFLWEHIEKVKKLEREEIMKGAIEARDKNKT